MVHNGIEYGDMQLIAEAYDLLRNTLGLDHTQLNAVFEEWNATDELNSFLIEITAKIFNVLDTDTGKPLVRCGPGCSGSKRHGPLETVISALELGVPIPTITAAVNARVTSSYKDERVGCRENPVRTIWHLQRQYPSLY